MKSSVNRIICICVVAVDKYIDYLYFGLVHGPFSVSSKA